MAQFPSLNLWTDSWLADTAHMPRVDRDIYLHLLILMWRTPGCRVPNEIEWITARLRLTPQKHDDVKEIICEFFVFSNGHITPFGGRAERHIDWSLHPSRLLNSSWRKIRNQMLEAFSGRCATCQSDQGPFEIDHIFPRSKGGDNHWNNLQVLCRPCNRRKGARVCHA